MKKIEKIQIEIWKTDDGFMYDIYDEIKTSDICYDYLVDGGLCTGKIEDALGMAYEQTKQLIKNRNGKNSKAKG